MSNVFEFVAQGRSQSGKTSARGVRREGGVPAVIYGGAAAPQMLSLKHNEVLRHLEHEAVYSHILDIVIDGKSEKAILKDIQRHPSKPIVMHMDFQRVNESEKLRVNVPVHFINESTSVGAKKGGIVTHNLVDIEVACLPGNLPEYIEVDLIDVDVNESVHLSDVKLPEGVEIVALVHGGDHDLPIVSITQARGGGAEEEDEGAAEEAGEADE